MHRWLRQLQNGQFSAAKCEIYRPSLQRRGGDGDAHALLAPVVRVAAMCKRAITADVRLQPADDNDIAVRALKRMNLRV
jgi:hypothetical protein